MSIFENIYRRKYNAKNYRKYCKDASSSFVYTSIYLSYYKDLSELPKYIQNIHYITLFLADTLNSSLFLFFYDEEHAKYISEIRVALTEAKMDETLSLFNLAVQTFENLPINRSKSLNDFKNECPQNILYNANFYEEEFAKLQQNDYLYNQLNDYFLKNHNVYHRINI